MKTRDYGSMRPLCVCVSFCSATIVSEFHEYIQVMSSAERKVISKIRFNCCEQVIIVNASQENVTKVNMKDVERLERLF